MSCIQNENTNEILDKNDNSKRDTFHTKPVIIERKPIDFKKLYGIWYHVSYHEYEDTTLLSYLKDTVRVNSSNHPDVIYDSLGNSKVFYDTTDVFYLYKIDSQKCEIITLYVGKLRIDTMSIDKIIHLDNKFCLLNYDGDGYELLMKGNSKAFYKWWTKSYD